MGLFSTPGPEPVDEFDQDPDIKFRRDCEARDALLSFGEVKERRREMQERRAAGQIPSVNGPGRYPDELLDEMEVREYGRDVENAELEREQEYDASKRAYRRYLDDMHVHFDTGIYG
jgi:hypothetical protein